VLVVVLVLDPLGWDLEKSSIFPQQSCSGGLMARYQASLSRTRTTTSARTIDQQAKQFSGKSSQENKILIDSSTEDTKVGGD
jgi:hypothetical protein